MGIEEIQKINALARELMKHGIAHTSDEAVLRAEEMLRANSVDSMTESITHNTSNGKSAPALVSQEAISTVNMDIRSLGVRFDAIAREVLSLKEEIKKLGGNLGDVSQQVTRLSVHGLQAAHSMPAEQNVAVAAATVAPQASVQQSFARESVQSVPQFERPKAPAARQKEDQYKPEDVAIEKIFYFGK